MTMNQVERYREKDQQGHGHGPGRKRWREIPARSWP